MFGVSYSTRYDEVKIHNGSCRFVIGQSQKGTTKWENHNEFGGAVRAANRLSSRPNIWRNAQCCRRNAGYLYQCIRCSTLSRGKRFVKKSVLGLFLLFTIGVSIIASITLPTLAPNFYSQIGPGPFGGLFFIGFIGSLIIYFAHPKRCPNCRTKDFR